METMAQFRATIEGQRGATSRLGSKKSGLYVNVNGWHDGVKVTAYYDAATDSDVFQVFATGGSNGAKESLFVGKIVNGKWQAGQ
jgi:hypothetical protein